MYARTVDGMDRSARAQFDASLLPAPVSAATGKPVPSWVARKMTGARQRNLAGPNVTPAPVAPGRGTRRR